MLEIDKNHQGNCLELMNDIPNKSVNMILTDLPYGITECKWDSVIPLGLMWEHLKRIIKLNGAIVMTASQPFTTVLIASNIKMFKYSLVWKKKGTNAGFAQAPYRFLKEHEDIVIFSYGGTSKNARTRMVYNPQGLKDCDRVIKGRTESSHRSGRKKQEDYIQKKTGYPKSILTFKEDNHWQHPTQKPVALFEYLIKTYTNKGDLVLDICMGSGTTAEACLKTERRFIGIELEEKYITIANVRIKKYLEQIKLITPIPSNTNILEY